MAWRETPGWVHSGHVGEEWHAGGIQSQGQAGTGGKYYRFVVLTMNSCFKKSLKELIVEQQFYAHKKVKVHFVDWTKCTCMNNETKLVIF